MSEIDTPRSPRSPGGASVTGSPRKGRGIAASSVASFGSFLIPRPILKTKGRALRVQLALFLIEIIFTVSTVLGIWLIFDLPNHGTTQTFVMTFSFTAQGKDPAKPNEIVRIDVVPYPAQLCAYSAIACAVLGFLLTIVATYSTKVPERMVKVLYGFCVFLALAILFLQVAAQAGFEANLRQLVTVVSLTGSIEGVDYSGRGYGYAALIISWILAIPLFIVSNAVFFGHLRGAWEHNWRETLRASWGQGIPDWLQGAINAADSASGASTSPSKSVVPAPFSIDTSLKLSPSI